jgi:hypothetical protein
MSLSTRWRDSVSPGSVQGKVPKTSPETALHSDYLITSTCATCDSDAVPIPSVPKFRPIQTIRDDMDTERTVIGRTVSCNNKTGLLRRDNSVHIGYVLDDRRRGGFDFWRFLSALQRPDRFWDPSSLLYSIILVIRHIWDQGTAGLPKATDYWKKSEQIYFYFLYFSWYHIS